MPFDGFPPFPLNPADYTMEERCRIVADVIERGVFGFDMDSWQKPDACGTAGCISGTARAVFSFPGSPKCEIANSAVGLGFASRNNELFQPWNFGGPYARFITRAMAASTLRHYADTGEIKWKFD